jgi:hypothetical protein
MFDIQRAQSMYVTRPGVQAGIESPNLKSGTVNVGQTLRRLAQRNCKILTLVRERWKKLLKKTNEQTRLSSHAVTMMMMMMMLSAGLQ